MEERKPAESLQNKDKVSGRQLARQRRTKRHKRRQRRCCGFVCVAVVLSLPVLN